MLKRLSRGRKSRQRLTAEQTIRAFVKMHAQDENAGDALVLRHLIQLISARVPTRLYLGEWPQTFVRQLALTGNAAVTALEGRSAASLVLDILRARIHGDLCYYFLTAGAPHGERTLKQFAADIFRISWLACLAALGVRICQVGVSFEDIGPRHARVLRWRSRLLFASVPRDDISRRYMRSLGIRTTGIMPDVTLNMFSTPPRPRGDSRTRVAFSFRVDKYPDIKHRLSEIVTDLASQCTGQADLFFVAQVSRDVTFMRELATAAEAAWPERVHFADCHQDIDGAFSIYQQCSVVLSNRLHALLPSLKEGATPIALLVPERDPKIVGVLESIGLGDYALDVRSVAVSEISRLMAPINFDGLDVAASLNQFFDELLLS